MSELAYKIDELEKAEQRLLDAACEMNLSQLVLSLPLRVVPGIETAAWVYNRTTKRGEIWVEPKMALELPMATLQALLLHELLHHAGFNELQHQFPEGTSNDAMNLALDVAIERIIARSSLAAASKELGDLVRVRPLQEGPRPAPDEQALVLLAHPDPPQDLMSKELRRVWAYFWKNPLASLSPVEIAWQMDRFYDAKEFGPGKLLWVLLPGGADCQRPLKKEGRDHVLVVVDPRSGERWEGVIRRPAPDSRSAQKQQEQLLGELQANSLQWGLGPSNLECLGLDRQVEIPEADAEAAQELFRTCVTDKTPQWPIRALQHLFGERFKQQVCFRPCLVHPTPAELARRAVNWPAFTFANVNYQRAGVVAVYVDVSGSMTSLAAEVKALLEKIKQWLPSRIFIFDTAIKELALEELLRKGEYWFGGGTDFDVVFQHALDHQFNESVVITDGCSWVTDSVLEACKRRGIKVNAIIFGSDEDCHNGVPANETGIGPWEPDPSLSVPHRASWWHRTVLVGQKKVAYPSGE